MNKTTRRIVKSDRTGKTTPRANGEVICRGELWRATDSVVNALGMLWCAKPAEKFVVPPTHDCSGDLPD
ncbi:MAG TPA: hypothetical protein PLV05_12350 [Verrucomicrobiota bacterium]|jgi:hypothetical protein|nr:hypothetical protein [Verrucomicrobiota bacterium]OQC24829.1 MAG: hypothetical protein BWX68_01936 [Verrucomicrobia bacterium ADurb.Bin063]HCL92255.1 hypothetical protein [Limisphaerales bacterium]HRR65688.1 hypothetical protein [Candidatus Paceibacterota bacterium]MBP8015000.1 hypothetical protein [Verrucomicrobiota bacterium]